MRKLAGLMAMILFALLLAACGDDEDTGDATEAATTASTVAALATEETDETATVEDATEAATEIATESAAGTALDSTPVMAASPIGAMATPASEALPATVGTPVASPVAAASPVSGMAVAPVGAAASDAATMSLSGEVTLPGTAGETYVITEDGCVGLNGYSDLRAGRQVVVRDESGTIIGVTEIAASDATDACSWTFSVDVPEADFYAVSIPMEVERVFSQEEVDASGGEITMPLR